MKKISLTDLQNKKVTELIDVMPMRKLYRVQSKPKVCYKKDGTLSSHGRRWFDLLEEHGLAFPQNPSQN